MSKQPVSMLIRQSLLKLAIFSLIEKMKKIAARKQKAQQEQNPRNLLSLLTTIKVGDKSLKEKEKGKNQLTPLEITLK